jgi:NitT/TauT family transport system ATP-binding protein
MAHLHCKNLQKSYPQPDGSRLQILSDINFTVKPGEFITVVGPSGCGKSTLLRMILGSETPTSGELLMHDKPLSHVTRDRGIVFQKYSIFPHMTVLENVMYGMELEEIDFLMKWISYFKYRRKKAQFKEKAMEYLKKVHLEDHAQKYPHQLSGGMRQRVAIAQAMVMSPSILLMDEPFGALDSGTRTSLQQMIVKTHEKEGNTIFFVTHDLHEAISLGTRVLVLSSLYPENKNRHLGSRLVHDQELSDKRDGIYQPKFGEALAKIKKIGFGIK